MSRSRIRARGKRPPHRSNSRSRRWSAMTMLSVRALIATSCFARLLLSSARCRSGGCCEEVCGTYCDENHACHSDDERCQNVGEACAAPKSAPMPTPKHTPKPRHQLATNQTVQCAAEPVSLFVIQNNCMGSTWLGHLLEQHECREAEKPSWKQELEELGRRFIVGGQREKGLSSCIRDRLFQGLACDRMGGAFEPARYRRARVRSVRWRDGKR